ncbi:hypothetical protein HOV44_gp133 [Rheinheimera phage Barba5S]|jgi:hypothetical protein|uniref:Uncharacterized protein n=4 Tax=Barbavirus TaxID=2733095 RepID=A0A4P8N379_9CAUD|nr:hypothetical protein HOV44_gp133 [Rheinheimera phage Barba5S]YP_009822865.1 hypothetical protein HOV45_gp129 [Rheinheimera phage Barba8S]QCQ61140.1 hypothetical protein Barba15A_gp131 [Rheinheimera phage vB_RspM_Barba15A]QCQ63625.1 hypothetical protein Barba26A_gp128 [Rheinheimera phage vB_RspM_Barba26A]QCQ59211.1 hypothetical protein Barba5S_gp133 [Rheinheimera phage Barba5S]QCQ59760.1 hypothetical protein Barba8S_gp129 [Rheinheimera phage Barba8S]
MFDKIKSKIKSLFGKVKQYLKSRTVNVGLIITMMGVVEMNLSFLQPTFGDNFGLVSIAYGILMVYLRSITTNSIQDK